jgi:SAM-dependent methyltransferase
VATSVYPTANSGTPVAYGDDWYVADIGSGHNPHPRANVLVDRFLLDDRERSGRAIDRPPGTPLVVADGAHLPFRDGSLDFAICSHVLEHVPDAAAFCAELQRAARAGYLETPGALAELLRHPPNHRWLVHAHNGGLHVRPLGPGHPLGRLGKLFYSAYFYGTNQAAGRDVYAFALGVPKPRHYLFAAVRTLLVRLWLALPAVTYTRLHWRGRFACAVRGW